MSIHQTIMIYDTIPDGHRSGYVRTYCRALGGSPLIAPFRASVFRLLGARRLVLPTFETSPVAFALLALARAALRRDTVVNLLRAHLQSHRKGLRRVIHRAAMAMLHRSRHVQLLSIVESPYLRGTYPKMVFLTDPEFWDLDPATIKAAHSDLADHAQSLANGRPILLVAGTIDCSKGIGILRALVEAHPDLSRHVLIVVAGHVLDDAHEHCAAIAASGAYVEDRYLSDSEFLSLFKAASYAWCCYAPERDMSSGIFGRCLQLGTVPLVRKGALIANFATDQQQRLIVDPEDLSVTANALMLSGPKGEINTADSLDHGKKLRQVVQSFFDGE